MKKSLAFSLSCFFSMLIIFPSLSLASNLHTNVTISHSNINNLTFLSSSQNLSLFNLDSLDGGQIEEEKNSRSVIYTLPIFPQRYGVLLPLSFGTPPQTVNLLFHTGSGLTWLPCGNFSVQKNISLFNPSLSASYKLPGCSNIMSRFYFRDKRYEQVCQNCNARKSALSCSKPLAYKITYLQGSTKGFLLSENLTIQQKNIPNFLLGCSSTYNFTHYGFVGFGRGDFSLPFQLDIKKFSYYLSSNQSREHESYLRMTTKSSTRMHYPIKIYSSPNTQFRDFYYVIVTNIIVGQKKVEIPKDAQVPRPDGFGGTIIDTGTTFTIVEKKIFQRVTREFEAQIGKGTFIDNNTDKTMSCFNVSGKKESDLPRLAFQFQGDILMRLQPHNYLIYEREIACLSIVAKANVVGPAISLGYIQQLDFRMMFDLEEMGLDFKQLNYH